MKKAPVLAPGRRPARFPALFFRAGPQVGPLAGRKVLDLAELGQEGNWVPELALVPALEVPAVEVEPAPFLGSVVGGVAAERAGESEADREILVAPLFGLVREALVQDPLERVGQLDLQVVRVHFVGAVAGEFRDVERGREDGGEIGLRGGLHGRGG